MWCLFDKLLKKLGWKKLIKHVNFLKLKIFKLINEGKALSTYQHFILWQSDSLDGHSNDIFNLKWVLYFEKLKSNLVVGQIY